MAGFVTQIGEAFVGEGAEAAHLNTVLGERGGPVETAWATALATPRQGHAAFLAVVRPGIAAKPPTLFVNKAALESESHAQLTWGAAQAGVASGVMRAVEDGVIERSLVDDLILIAAVWVDPERGRCRPGLRQQPARRRAWRSKPERIGLPASTRRSEPRSRRSTPSFRSPV